MKIKPILLFFFLSIFFIESGYSQQFEGGAIGGIVGSQVQGDPTSGYNKLGGYFGVYARRKFTLKSAVQMEMYYIQKGARQNGTEENGFNQYLLRINMIELPIMYKYTINKKLLMSIGLAYTYIFGDPYEEYNFSTNVPNTPWNRHSLTFILGIEYDLTDKLSIVFRTNNSITPIRDHASGQKRFFNRGQYSDALIFGLCYNFINQ
jgi:opacity protein-like surface antigen